MLNCVYMADFGAAFVAIIAPSASDVATNDSRIAKGIAHESMQNPATKRDQQLRVVLRLNLPRIDSEPDVSESDQQ